MKQYTSYSLGLLDNTNLLGLIGSEFPLISGEIPNLSGKKIGDIGSGVSGFLEYLKKYTKDTHFTNVDSIYENDDIFFENIDNDKGDLYNKIYDIRKGIEKILTSKNSQHHLEEILYSYNMRKRKLKVIESIGSLDTYMNPSITYFHAHESLKLSQYDILFMTNFFQYIEQPEEYLQFCEDRLTYNGYLIISDYTNKTNIQSLEQAAQEGKIRKVGEQDGMSSYKIMKYQISSIIREDEPKVNGLGRTQRDLFKFLNG